MGYQTENEIPLLSTQLLEYLFSLYNGYYNLLLHDPKKFRDKFDHLKDGFHTPYFRSLHLCVKKVKVGTAKVSKV